MKIGKQLKDIRAALGLTQKDVEDAKVMSREYLSILENDRVSPNISTLVPLLKYYKHELIIRAKGAADV